MRIDITSFFFNTTIKDATATAAWGIAIGQSKVNNYKINTEIEGLNNFLIGMNYRAQSDYLNLDISKMSSKRELLYFSIFDKIFVNGIKVENYSYIILFAKEHSETHEGRLIISYPNYAKYENVAIEKKVDNNETIKKIAEIIESQNGSWFVYDLTILNQDELHFSAVVVDKDNSIEYAKSKDRKDEWSNLIAKRENKKERNFTVDINNKIYFGSPGTGKSRELDIETKGFKRTRTTFHPETDYYSFVGSYKPVMDGVNIKYEFIPQAFTKAYCNAWLNPKEPYFLIIEELNRGNCAQIFGDIFQCLDRDSSGQSEYGIDCDNDLAKYLKEKFEKDATPEVLEIYKQTIDSEDFDKIILPSNLYIYATMNTSDQSLFPMDSAFKRRWDMKFVPVDYEDANKLVIFVDEDTIYNWGNFISNINPKIKELTGSEDKQLGNRFINPSDGKITFEQFRSKVLFYLWSEIYKDEVGSLNSIFKYQILDEDPIEFQFGELFEEREDKISQLELFKGFMHFNGIETKPNK